MVMLTYMKNENGTIAIENVLKTKRRYTIYVGLTLAQAKRIHRKEQDLKNVAIQWVDLNG